MHADGIERRVLPVLAVAHAHFSSTRTPYSKNAGCYHQKCRYRCSSVPYIILVALTCLIALETSAIIIAP